MKKYKTIFWLITLKRYSIEYLKLKQDKKHFNDFKYRVNSLNVIYKH